MSAIRPLHLAVALDGPAHYDANHYVALARLAERGVLDFVTLGDSYTRPGLDALAVLSGVAPATERIGLVPTVNTTHTEPFHVSASLATLDRISRGRAGWTVGTSHTEAEARLFGRVATAPPDALWRAAGDAVDAVTRLWDGCGDDAGLHDAPSGSAGRGGARPTDSPTCTFGVSGPTGGPSSPQGRPVTVVDGTREPGRKTAARYADVVLVRATAPEEAAALRADVHRRAASYGRDPRTLRVMVSLVVDLGAGESALPPGRDTGPPLPGGGPHFSGGPVDLAELIARWHREGAADGFHLVPIAQHHDLERIVNGTVALLQHRGLFRTFHPGGTLREHLGLPRTSKRYVAVGEPA